MIFKENSKDKTDVSPVLYITFSFPFPGWELLEMNTDNEVRM